MAQKNLIQNQPDPPEEVEETESTETTETEAQVEEPDYKALLEQSKADLLQAENNNKSLLGRIREPAPDPRIDQLLDTLSGQEKRLNALATRTASGETEELTEDMAKINADTDQARATRQFEQGWKGMEVQLEDALRGDPKEDGSPGDLAVDVESPEVKELVTSWNAAKAKGNLVDGSAVVGQARTLTAKVLREQRAKAAETATAEVETAQKAKDAKNGVHDLNAGTPRTGSGSGMSRQQIEEATDPSQISDEDFAKYIKGEI